MNDTENGQPAPTQAEVEALDKALREFQNGVFVIIDQFFPPSRRKGWPNPPNPD